MRPDVKRLRNQDTGCRPMRLRMVSVWTAFLMYGIACTRSADDPQSDASSSMAQAAPDAQLTREIIRARSELGRLSGAGVRAVWTREVGEAPTTMSDCPSWAFDSRNNEGERSIVSEPSDYAKPLITPSGDRAVFSKLSDDGVYVVDWDGGNKRRVASGFGLVVWRDPSNGREWVYVGSEQAGRAPPAYRLITRHLLDDPSTAEQVWDAQPVSGNSFQLSRDARFAGGLFPWPAAGVADLDAGTWRRLGEGCWTALASDDSRLFWFFDGSHRNLTIVDVNRERRWRVTINDAPGIRGFEVYHPKWTNHPRFMVMTGPYTVGPGANKVRAGGRQVEIFLGRFAADFTTVESWAQVTHNDSEEFYPDVWIDPAGPTFVTNSREVGPKDETSPPARKGHRGGLRSIDRRCRGAGRCAVTDPRFNRPLQACDVGHGVLLGGCGRGRLRWTEAHCGALGHSRQGRCSTRPRVQRVSAIGWCWSPTTITRSSKASDSSWRRTIFSSPSTTIWVPPMPSRCASLVAPLSHRAETRVDLREPGARTMSPSAPRVL